MSTSSSLADALIVVETAGTFAFALSGLIEAARKRLDAVGVCFVAGLTAFGGGTVRDVLLDRRPFFWVAHAGWLWTLLVACALVTLVLRARHLPPTERAMQAPHAFGLGLFAASGTQIALDASMPSIVAVLMGTVTAAFGGVLRDVVCNEIPRVFNDHRPYAVCAFAGSWVVVLAQALGWPQPLGLAAVRCWRSCCACSRPPSTGSCQPGVRSRQGRGRQEPGACNFFRSHGFRYPLPRRDKTVNGFLSAGPLGALKRCILSSGHARKQIGL